MDRAYAAKDNTPRRKPRGVSRLDCVTGRLVLCSQRHVLYTPLSRSKQGSGHGIVARTIGNGGT